MVRQPCFPGSQSGREANPDAWVLASAGTGQLFKNSWSRSSGSEVVAPLGRAFSRGFGGEQPQQVTAMGRFVESNYPPNRVPRMPRNRFPATRTGNSAGSSLLFRLGAAGYSASFCKSAEKLEAREHPIGKNPGKDPLLPRTPESCPPRRTVAGNGGRLGTCQGGIPPDCGTHDPAQGFGMNR